MGRWGWIVAAVVAFMLLGRRGTRPGVTGPSSGPSSPPWLDDAAARSKLVGLYQLATETSPGGPQAQRVSNAIQDAWLPWVGLDFAGVVEILNKAGTPAASSELVAAMSADVALTAHLLAELARLHPNANVRQKLEAVLDQMVDLEMDNKEAQAAELGSDAIRDTAIMRIGAAA